MTMDSTFTREGSSNRPRMAVSFGLILCVGLLSGCGVLSKGQTAFDVSAKDMGVSSWYGEDFHGKLAADGKPFDRHALTAAHRSLPLGSVVRVLNVQNARAVYVRITDRGPYIQGRMLDLSEGAAERLGMVKRGVAPVVVTVVGKGQVPDQWPPVTSTMLAGLQASLHDVPGGESKGHYHPVGVGPVQRQPEDLWRQPRQRRVVDVLAADHHVDRFAVALFIAWMV